MSTPINFWKSDKDYYAVTDIKYKDHIKRIRDNLRIDKLINLASSDGSYSLTVKKD